MRVFKWLFWITLWAVVGVFLHYTLPQKDVVRVVGTDISLQDVGDRPLFWARPNLGQATLAIRGVFADGETMEYRNEDTGLGWPPYFKSNSDEVHTRAQLAAQEGDGWVVIRHYGIRSDLLSIYPNALRVRAAPEGPDTVAISWTRWIVLGLLALVLWAILSRWRRFKQGRITPILDDADAAWDMRTARWRRNRERRRAERLARGE